MKFTIWRKILERIQAIEWLSVPVLGTVLILLGIMGNVLGYIRETEGITFSGVLGFPLWLITNLSGELVGIAFTVLIVDWIYARRARKELLAQLIRQMGSPDNGLSLMAAKELLSLNATQNGTLRKARFHDANLAGLELIEADLREVILYEASLKNAVLYNSDLSGANLKHADLEEANLNFANLDNANLSNASFIRAGLRGAKLRGANLSETVLAGAILRDADLTGADLANASLKDADLWGTNFKLVENLTSKQLKAASRLWHATMSDGSIYDGRFNLKRDLETATSRGASPEVPDTMAEFYGVTVEQFLAGQSKVKK